MGRAFYRLFLRGLCLSLFMMKSFESFGVMSVFDSSNYSNLTQIITSGNKLLNEQKHMGGSLDTLNTSLGSPMPFDFSKLERMIRRKSFSLSDFSVIEPLLSGFDPPQTDFLSKRTHYENALLPRFNTQGLLSHEEHQKVGQRRNTLFKESVLSGLALASQQRSALQISQAELTSTLKDAHLSRDLRSDVAITNKLLTMIVNEMIQMRALQLQQLEIKSTEGAMSLPIALEVQEKSQNQPQTRDTGSLRMAPTQRGRHD